MAIVQTRCISKCFSDETYGLKEVSLEVHRGEVVAVVGPNGAGKTTLMRCLAGLYAPTQGEVCLAMEGGPYPPLSLMLESSGLFDHFTVLHNLFFYADLIGYNHSKMEQSLLAYLSEFDLEGLQTNLVKSLSAGERRLMSLFRSTFFNPHLLLLDEPTAHLDPTNQIRVTNYVRRLRDRTGATILFSSHNLADVTHAADRTVFLRKGELVLDIARNQFTGYRLLVQDMESVESPVPDPFRSFNSCWQDGKRCFLLNAEQLTALGAPPAGFSVRQPNLREFYACVYS